jgi:hypothetical protein
MPRRGWSQADVVQALSQPVRTVATTDQRHLPGGGRMNAPATAYVRSDGSYVVRNDVTGEIIQVSDRNNPNWLGL